MSGFPEGGQLSYPTQTRRSLLRKLAPALGLSLLSGTGMPLAGQSVASPDAPPEPPREFRSAWIASVHNIDWPSKPGLSSAEQQKELIAILDSAQSVGLNAVFLQVRPACDALYKSDLEPWSPWLTGEMGRPPSPLYDPLAFALKEAHARGLELHAWFNPFRAMASPKFAASSGHVSKQKPGVIRRYGDYQWLDPSDAWVQKRAIDVMLDVVRRYPVDGIHIDDYFYPYPVRKDGKIIDFPDDAAWATYQKTGGPISSGSEELNGVVKNLLSSYALALPVVLMMIGLGSWWLSRLALRPIETIISRANNLTAARLRERLPVPPANDEIGRLTAVLNNMFDRLESSFQQVAQFTSDASHELKTPVAIMRGEIETALNSGVCSGEQEKVLLSLLEEVMHLSKITDNLLLLSQADAGRLEMKLSPLDFSALTAEIVEDMEIVAHARAVEMRTQISPGVRVMADAHQLRRILLNLLDNAIKYNQPNGILALTLTQTGNTVILIIGNTGQDIRPEQRQKIFQRFYRGETSHEYRIDGHGLGLSICREIAKAHGGTLELIRSDQSWTEFSLSLPAAFVNPSP